MSLGGAFPAIGELDTRRGQMFPALSASQIARVTNSVKRLASAVGEGSMCIQLLHKLLAE